MGRGVQMQRDGRDGFHGEGGVSLKIVAGFLGLARFGDWRFSWPCVTGNGFIRLRPRLAGLSSRCIPSNHWMYSRKLSNFMQYLFRVKQEGDEIAKPVALRLDTSFRPTSLGAVPRLPPR